MKYIKLFENFNDDKQKELADELAAYLGVNLDTFAETSKIMAMSPEGIQRWFDAEMDKEEPNIPVIEELERLGYEFNLLKEDLFYAARHNKVGLAKILLDRGADYKARDEAKRTPLHLAAWYDSLAVAELLLDRGAKIDVRDVNQWTPLHFAAIYNRLDIAWLLLDRGAKIEARSVFQRTPWDLANEEMQKALPQLNPNYKDS